MTRAAVIKDNVVENVIIWGPSWNPPEGHIVVPSEDAEVGWLYDGEKFSNPNIILPTIKELKEHASDYRKYIESLPITHQRKSEIFVIKTDNTSMARLHRLYMMAIKDESLKFNWESTNRISELSASEIIEINDLINTNMQKSYNVLKKIYNSIDSGDITTYEEINEYPWIS